MPSPLLAVAALFHHHASVPVVKLINHPVALALVWNLIKYTFLDSTRIEIIFLLIVNLMAVK